MEYWKLFAAGAILLSASCSDRSTDASAGGPQAECIEPNNPFNDEGGHDAGFKWAEETGGECPDDRGGSFHEGCEEYHTQGERFEACEEAKRK